MKKLNEVKHLTDQQKKRDYVLAIQSLVLQQIDAVANLMERNAEHVVSPLCFNACAGLIDQLKLQAFAAFIDHGGIAPAVPDGESAPYFKITHGE
jgi:hypothetical protein